MRCAAAPHLRRSYRHTHARTKSPSMLSCIFRVRARHFQMRLFHRSLACSLCGIFAWTPEARFNFNQITSQATTSRRSCVFLCAVRRRTGGRTDKRMSESMFYAVRAVRSCPNILHEPGGAHTDDYDDKCQLLRRFVQVRVCVQYKHTLLLTNTLIAKTPFAQRTTTNGAQWH